MYSSAVSHTVDWRMFTDVSMQPIGSIFSGQAFFIGSLGICQPTLRNFLERRKCGFASRRKPEDADAGYISMRVTKILRKTLTPIAAIAQSIQ